MSYITIECLHEHLNEKYKHTKNHKGDSGFDLYCPKEVIVPANVHSYKIPLGIKSEVFTRRHPSHPETTVYKGYMLLPRSSTGSKTPLRLSNSVGIIDKSYRGEIMAVVDNLSSDQYVIQKNDRLFQLVPFDGNGIQSVTLGPVSETDRGSGRFGSTGV